MKVDAAISPVSRPGVSTLRLAVAGRQSQFGVHLECLPPGSRSSFRHWHEAEDEMVYVLSGELVLVEDSQAALVAGDVGCGPAGVAAAHYLENRSGTAACYLIIGSRKAQGAGRDPLSRRQPDRLEGRLSATLSACRWHCRHPETDLKGPLE